MSRMRRAGVFAAALLVLFAGRAAAQFALYPKDNGRPLVHIQIWALKAYSNGARPEKKMAFPKISNWRSLVIELVRGGCFGTCPSYGVKIRADGRVTFDGRNYVAIPGMGTVRIRTTGVRN